MKYDYKQRMEMARNGIDPDVMENPKQRIPPVDLRIAQLEDRLKSGHPRSNWYKKQLKVYRVLKGEDASPWRRFFGG